jgi:O-Antigen ligase
VESVAAIGSAIRSPRILQRVDARALSVWALVGSIVLYLAIKGGGYDIVVRSHVGVVIWWIVLVGAALGLLPAARLSRLAWAGLALFGGFVAWTALASTWSLSSERSLQDLSLVACYLGVLVLGVAIHRDREHAVRHTINALGAAIVLVAALALASRLRPDLFPAAQQTSSFLAGTQGRLGWPLNYWNALGALVALGLPLLLSIATSARTLRAQAAAAAGIPIVVLCGYLTFSRGSAIAASVAVIIFIALAPERVPKLATMVVAGVGSAALIAGAVHRSAIESGLVDAAARHQGATLITAVILVCAGVGLAQAGIGLAVRHGTPPRWLVVPRQRARLLLLAGLGGCVVVALLAGAPARVSHAWQDFQHPTAAALQQNSIARFGTISGNGRYELWKVAVNSTSGHLLGGSGPGTFQLVWLPRAPVPGYVQNAHSLYLETLSDVGAVGLLAVLGFFVLVIGAAVRLVTRSRFEPRVRAAGVAAGLVAFSVSAAFDWIWQVPVLPAAFLLLAAAVLAPASKRETAPSLSRGAGRIAIRVGAVVLAIACLVAIGVPLATTNAVRQSQAAVTSGDTALALADARAAVRVQPGAASAQIQLALVLELEHNFRAALVAGGRATSAEPDNWSTWLVVSRLDAEAGHSAASLAAYRRAQSLNPHSPIFRL